MNGDASYVYVLRSLTSGRYYVGCSSDPERRLMEHNSGENFPARGRGPYELVYHKRFETLGDARQYERYLKARKSSKYIARIIKNG